MLLLISPKTWVSVFLNLSKKVKLNRFPYFFWFWHQTYFFTWKVKKISFFYIRGLFSGRNGVEGMRKHYPVEIYYYNFSHSVSICPPCSFRIYPGEWPRMTIRPSVGHLEQQYLRETISDILHINIILVACKLLGALQAKPCMRSRSTDNICEISLYTKY